MDFSDLDELVSETPLSADFNRAAEFIKSHHDKFTPDDLLEIYAFYKQATVGPCDTPKPGVFQLQSRAKWTAWNRLRDMTAEKAMEKYLEKLTTVEPEWRKAEEREEDTGWVATSKPKPEVAEGQRSETIYDFIKEENFEAVKKFLDEASEEQVNKLDETGLGIIHWTADRGYTKILELLLSSSKVLVNLNDSQGQTALHYASSCGHLECIELLLKHGADPKLLDEDGENSYDAAMDEKVRGFFEKMGIRH